MILHLLLHQEYDMDIMSSQTQILQLIGPSLRKVITLPILLPSANGSNELIDILKKKVKKEWIADMQKLANSFPFSIVRINKVKWSNEYKIKFWGKENVDFAC